MKSTVTVQGLAELERNLKRFESGLLNELEPAAIAAGEMVAEVARHKGDYKDKTGELRRGIGVKKVEVKRASVNVYVSPSKKAFYARMVEYGHKLKRTRKGQVLGNTRPFPFLRPAYDETKTRAQDVIRDALARLIERWR